MRVLKQASTNRGGGRFRPRRAVALVIAGLLVAGGGLPLVAATTSATPLPAGRSAVQKPDLKARVSRTVDPTFDGRTTGIPGVARTRDHG